MKLILLGAPGAGKGTQAAGICKDFNIEHISTGAIFRKNMQDKTEIGIIAASFIDKGDLVPDDVTFELVKQRLSEEDCKNGWLLDGFPRNVCQADMLESFCQADYCLNIDIAQEKLISRLMGRRVCPSCSKSFNVAFLNGKTTCDDCGCTLITRSDDHEEQVRERMHVYNEQTQPLIEYYAKKGKLISVDGDGTFEEVANRIKFALKK